MDNKQNDDQLIFSVTVDDLQKEATKLIGRKLIVEELNSVIKGVEEGLSFDAEIVAKSAIEEAVD